MGGAVRGAHFGRWAGDAAGDGGSAGPASCSGVVPLSSLDSHRPFCVTSGRSISSGERGGLDVAPSRGLVVPAYPLNSHRPFCVTSGRSISSEGARRADVALARGPVVPAYPLNSHRPFCVTSGRSISSGEPGGLDVAPSRVLARGSPADLPGAGAVRAAIVLTGVAATAFVTQDSSAVRGHAKRAGFGRNCSSAVGEASRRKTFAALATSFDGRASTVPRPLREGLPVRRADPSVNLRGSRLQRRRSARER
jgi:endogenous inhibitor of DNA gyrase (YacG/DUF329 family)